MKFSIATLGRDSGPFADLVSKTTKFGMRMENYHDFDKLLADLLQDTEVDALVVEQSNQQTEVIEISELINNEHNLNLPIIGVFGDKIDEQKDKLLNYDGIFALISTQSRSSELARTLFQACAHSKLLKLCQEQFKQSSKLLEIVRTVDQGLKSAQEQTDAFDSDAFLSTIKGYDFSKEISRAEQSIQNGGVVFERVNGSSNKF